MAEWKTVTFQGSHPWGRTLEEWMAAPGGAEVLRRWRDSDDLKVLTRATCPLPWGGEVVGRIERLRRDAEEIERGIRTARLMCTVMARGSIQEVVLRREPRFLLADLHLMRTYARFAGPHPQGDRRTMALQIGEHSRLEMGDPERMIRVGLALMDSTVDDEEAMWRSQVNVAAVRPGPLRRENQAWMRLWRSGTKKHRERSEDDLDTLMASLPSWMAVPQHENESDPRLLAWSLESARNEAMRRFLRTIERFIALARSKSTDKGWVGMALVRPHWLAMVALEHLTGAIGPEGIEDRGIEPLAPTEIRSRFIDAFGE